MKFERCILTVSVRVMLNSIRISKKEFNISIIFSVLHNKRILKNLESSAKILKINVQQLLKIGEDL
jgi:hypothetical protein